MAESATTETLAFLTKLVQESLDECKDFWQSMEEQSKLLSMVEFTGTYRESHSGIVLLTDICHSWRGRDEGQ